MSEEALLPPNATIWERAVSGALAFGLDAEAVTRIKNPATCPVELLPYLAAEEGVDQWSATWPEAVKREAIERSWADHRQKGTPQAMDVAVAGLGPGYSWAEWFEYGGRPYRFRLSYRVGQGGFTFAALVRARDQVNRAKNVRSIMEFSAETEAQAEAFVGVFAIVNTALGDLDTTVPAVEAGAGVFALTQISLGDIA